MGNDNWDRIQPPGTIAAAFKMNLVSLEEKCSELWGPTQFDWVIGRTQHDDRDMWFYYAGTTTDVTGRPHWKVSGYADTIADALMELIKQYDE